MAEKEGILRQEAPALTVRDKDTSTISVSILEEIKTKS